MPRLGRKGRSWRIVRKLRNRVSLILDAAEAIVALPHEVSTFGSRVGVSMLSIATSASDIAAGIESLRTDVQGLRSDTDRVAGEIRKMRCAVDAATTSLDVTTDQVVDLMLKGVPRG